MEKNETLLGMSAMVCATICVLSVTFMLTDCTRYQSDQALETYKLGEEPSLAPNGKLWMKPKKKTNDK